MATPRHASEFDRTTKDRTLADLEANAAIFREFLVGISANELPMGAVHGPAGDVGRPRRERC